MNVDMRHLRALAAIGDEGTVTGAARALHITQPALSRTLEQLESRLGVRLVERTTRRLELTDAGLRLWEHAHRILRQLDDALAEAAAPAGPPRPLRLAFAWAALGRHTVPLLRAWRQRRPEVRVEIRRLDDPEAALRRGLADLAFLRVRPHDTTSLTLVELASEPRLAALPEHHHLAGRAELTLADLADQMVALCSTAATTGVELWPRGRRPVTMDVPGVDEWLTTIATGEAVGVTSEGTSHHHPHPGVRYIPLADAAPVPVYLARPTDPAHSATVDFVRLAHHHFGHSSPSDIHHRRT
ncbi:LysR family transcriptional regulator [Streptomyces sp. 110]|uniref:LysR family transcriptional regulator n=1 Tax=Streptomyces endocoffeicus TaxID=2898945 RepID=A0ABS1PU57_9ACTN|nr:LysR family transcriptional regulator [Streptomyces endocoffeicus]MBL1115951.1 LysR family transcriptional regulator [Streptomyces endocoffeicus]